MASDAKIPARCRLRCQVENVVVQVVFVVIYTTIMRICPWEGKEEKIHGGKKMAEHQLCSGREGRYRMSSDQHSVTS